MTLEEEEEEEEEAEPMETWTHRCQGDQVIIIIVMLHLHLFLLIAEMISPTLGMSMTAAHSEHTRSLNTYNTSACPKSESVGVLLKPTGFYDDTVLPITTNLYISCISPKVSSTSVSSYALYVDPPHPDPPALGLKKSWWVRGCCTSGSLGNVAGFPC